MPVVRRDCKRKPHLVFVNTKADVPVWVVERKLSINLENEGDIRCCWYYSLRLETRLWSTWEDSDSLKVCRELMDLVMVKNVYDREVK